MLKRMKITNPTQQKKDDMEKKAIEENHAIIGANTYKYGKLIEDMKNDVIFEKDSFPKTVSEAIHVLSNWRNNYGGKYKNRSESNDGIAFTTMTDEKEKKPTKMTRKKRLTVSNARKKEIIPTNALKNCPRQQKRKAQAY